MITIPIQVPPMVLFICEDVRCRDRLKKKFNLSDKEYKGISGTIEYFFTNSTYKKYKTTICALITLNICKCKNRNIFQITLNTLIHEISHFINHIEDEYGIKNTEYRSYLMEYLVDQVFDKILYKKYELKEKK